MQEDEESKEDLPLLLRPYSQGLPRKEFAGFYSKYSEYHEFVLVQYFSEETRQLHSPWDEELQRRVPAETKVYHNGDRTEDYWYNGLHQRMEFLDEDQTEVLPCYIRFYPREQNLPPYVHYNVGLKTVFAGYYQDITSRFQKHMAEAVEALHEWIAAQQPLVKSALKR